MVDLVDLGDYQVVGMVGLEDREGPVLLTGLQALLLPLLVPMEGQPLQDFVLEDFLRRFLCLSLVCSFCFTGFRCWHMWSSICHMLFYDSVLFHTSSTTCIHIILSFL